MRRPVSFVLQVAQCAWARSASAWSTNDMLWVFYYYGFVQKVEIYPSDTWPNLVEVGPAAPRQSVGVHLFRTLICGAPRPVDIGVIPLDFGILVDVGVHADRTSFRIVDRFGSIWNGGPVPWATLPLQALRKATFAPALHGSEKPHGPRTHARSVRTTCRST